MFPTCLCTVLNEINTISKDSKLIDLHKKKLWSWLIYDHQVFQSDWHMNDFLVFWDQEITLHPNFWINDLQDPTWSTPQCVTLISMVRMYSLNSSDKSKITQILHAYPISSRRIRDDFLFCCKLTLQTEHCYFPRCAMTPKVNARHKQQCVRPVELRELSILPGQSSHVIFIFKFYWVFGIPYLNKQFHLKSACS